MISDTSRLIISIVIIVIVYIVIPSLIIMSIKPLRHIYQSAKGIISLIWITLILLVLLPSYTFIKHKMLIYNI
jgi:hypothetical protein